MQVHVRIRREGKPGRMDLRVRSVFHGRTRSSILRLGVLAALILPSLGIAAAAERPPRCVDFRYAPPQWQAAICLPDDPHKSLVNKSGELLYHYHYIKGGREFGTRVRRRSRARRRLAEAGVALAAGADREDVPRGGRTADCRRNVRRHGRPTPWVPRRQRPQRRALRPRREHRQRSEDRFTEADRSTRRSAFGKMINR